MPEEDTTRSDANPSREDASRDELFLTRGGVREERPSCLVCGARVGSGDPTIRIRGALVHMGCAVYRRRLVRR
jgi:hypothetical protein